MASVERSRTLGSRSWSASTRGKMARRSSSLPKAATTSPLTDLSDSSTSRAMSGLTASFCPRAPSAHAAAARTGGLVSCRAVIRGSTASGWPMAPKAKALAFRRRGCSAVSRIDTSISFAWVALSCPKASIAASRTNPSAPFWAASTKTGTACGSPSTPSP